MTALENLLGLEKLSQKMEFKAERGGVVRIAFHLTGTDEVVYKSVETSLARKFMEAH